MKEFLSKNWKRVLFAIILLVLVLIVPYTCSLRKEYRLLSGALSSEQFKNQKFTLERKKDSTLIAEQRQVILTERQAKEAGLLEIENLKNIKSTVHFGTISYIPAFYTPYTGIKIEPIEGLGSTSPTILPKFEASYEYKDPKGWFSQYGVATESGIRVDSTFFKDDYRITIGDKKLNFFEKEPKVLLTSQNPYTTISSMDNVVIIQIQPFYNKNSFWFVLGAAAGYSARGALK